MEAIVIRVQDKNGHGMFQFGQPDEYERISVYGIPELSELAKRHSDFPDVFGDPIINEVFDKEIGYEVINNQEYMGIKYRFAFKTLDQFEKWVKRKEVRILSEHGYRVFKIKAKCVIESEYQAVFDINSVESSEDITDLFL